MIAADIRDRHAVRAPSTASTSCSTTSPRCRSPGTTSCCARSTSTARASCSTPAATPVSPRSCTRRRARCSASPSRTRCCRPRCRGRRRRTATPSSPPSGRACGRPRAGLDVSIVRPRTILGHGRLGIFGILFDWIADGADPIVLGDGSNRYQFVHADDLATVCLLAGDHAGPASSTPAPTASARCATALAAPLRARRHGRQGARAAGRPDRAGDAGERGAGPHPVRPVPLADVRPLDVVRHRPRPSPSDGRRAGRPTR